MNMEAAILMQILKQEILQRKYPVFHACMILTIAYALFIVIVVIGTIKLQE